MENSVNNANQINFVSHKDSEENRTMYTKSRNIEVMSDSETD